MDILRNFLKEIKERVLIYDGSKGFMLQKMGLKGGECSELWNATHSDDVKKVYKLYKEAGSDVIQTNTFPGNRVQLQKYSLGERTYELNFKGAALAREVMGEDGFVAASIGPVGKLFEPSGELTFDYAYDIFKEQVKAVADGGADIINFETFTDVAEMRAALLAAKETTNLPVICSISFETNGRTLMGTDPYATAVVLKSLGADMIGTNCSTGPDQQVGIVQKMYEAGGLYLSVKPNAGLPEAINGEAVYKETAWKFSLLAGEFVKYGVRLIGGCCGTTPEFISAIKASVKDLPVPEILNRPKYLITSAVKILDMEQVGKLNIGRLNTEMDAELSNDLAKYSIDFAAEKAMEISGEGCDALYIDIDSINPDRLLLSKVVNAVQGFVKEPFILRTRDKEALEDALRLYKGKAGVVVDGYPESIMEELLIVARKYGSTVVCESIL